jgi:hypothetical protein
LISKKLNRLHLKKLPNTSKDALKENIERLRNNKRRNRLKRKKFKKDSKDQLENLLVKEVPVPRKEI